MSRDGKTAKTVLRLIEKEGPGATFGYDTFKGLPLLAVAKALSRLVKEKKIIRARKGVFHYPKNTLLGPSSSSPVAVLGSSYPDAYYGATLAPYNLSISTQVPASLVAFGNMSYGKTKILGQEIKFRKRDVAHLKNLTDTEFNIIETIRELKKIPGTSVHDALNGIKSEMKKKVNVSEMLKAVLYEAPRVRAIFGAICEELKLEVDKLERLRKSLNPLTHYSLETGYSLVMSEKWNIK